MRRRLFSIVFSALLAAAMICLSFVDFSEKLDKDVSSILPQPDTEAAQVARQLIGDAQGRAVYLKIGGIATNGPIGITVEEKVKGLELSPIVDSIVKVDSKTNGAALKVMDEHRLRLLFPKWFHEKRSQFQSEQSPSVDFPSWAAKVSVEELGSFLESPMAMELARPELLDPLLLGISAILVMDDVASEGGPASDPSESEQYYWLVLEGSPFSPSTQDSLGSLMDELEREVTQLDSRLTVRYGGLVKLAGASRNRIQNDVLKINLLSILGVLVVGCLLTPNPWKLAWFIPSLLSGVVGALGVSFLFFEQISILVLVIGSILVGTTIDYSIHLAFRDGKDEVFPTEKLVSYACLSTVVGFSILLFAELDLIRQIGVYVGSGLLVAFVVASITIRPGASLGRGRLLSRLAVAHPPPILVGLSVVALLVGLAGLTRQEWSDDLRNLEAPDAELVEEDISLRQDFGAVEKSSVFLTTGPTYLDALQDESSLFQKAGSNGFGYSKILPRRSEVNMLQEHKLELPMFFSHLRKELSVEGYEIEEFGRFWESADAFTSEPNFDDAFFEEPIQMLADSLVGMMSGGVGRVGELHWIISSMDLDADQAIDLAESTEGVTLFSNLVFLNKTLDQHRESLLRFGAIAMLLVAIVVVIAFGWRKGLLIVLYPILGGVIAIGIGSLLFPALSMFHLIGCFLGGAIALDYSLFAIEAYGRTLPIPSSVWISAGTTNASFLALTLSAIPAVQGLGAMVALLSCGTLLLLVSNQTLLRKVLLGND